MNYQHFTTDQNFADETTIYWFKGNGETYGVSDCHGYQTIVDCDGCPVNTDDAVNVHLLTDLVVTNEMMNQSNPNN